MLCHVFPQRIQTQPLCTEFLSAQRTSSLRYFSSRIHSGHFGIEKTEWLIAKKCYKDLQSLPIGQQVTTWAGLPMSTGWKDTSHDLGRIAYIYGLEGHQLRFDPHCRHAYEDGILQADADNDRFTHTGGRLHAFWAELRLPLYAERTFSTGLWHSKSLSAGPLGLRAWI